MLLVDELVESLRRHVELSELSELNWILGIGVTRIREERRLFLSQQSYIESAIRRYGFEDLKPLSIPMDVSTHLSSAQSPSTTANFARMQNIPYREAVGSLMYAALGTRPDCVAVSVCSSS